MTRVLVIEHEANAGVGLIGERLLLADIEMMIVGPEAGARIPSSPEDFDGVIVLGGSPGPQDDERAPWLPSVRELIAGCLVDELPLLGVCLGAQLLAVVAGGTVSSATNPEIGLVRLASTADAVGDALFDGLPSRLPAVEWHFLEVTRLPDGATPLLRSDRCANQAFRVGRAAWGVQFHLEALAATVADWARPDSPSLAVVGLVPPAVLEPVRRHEAEIRVVWSEVVDRWVGVLVASAGGLGATPKN